MDDRGPRREGRAEVVLDVDHHRGAFELVLVNLGDAVARNVSVEFSRPLGGARGVEVSSLPIFRLLRTLRPDKEIRVFYDSAAAVFAGEQGVGFRATVTWEDASGRSRSAVYDHDLNAYRCLPELEIPDRA